MGLSDNNLATKGGIYIRLDALRWAESQKHVRSPLARALLLLLARKSDMYGCCWYAQRTLAEETGFSDRGIRKHLKALAEDGLIRTVHRARGGLRTTNVYQLIGWPERRLLPSSGHPVAGRHVVEDATSLRLRLGNRHEVPLDADSGAVLNKDTEKTTITDAEKKAILDRCKQSLGSWATQKNCRALSRNEESLFEMLRQGFDLHHHILPTIREVVRDGRRVPNLNSWAYFADAVTARTQMASKMVAPEARTGLENADAGRGSGDTDTRGTGELGSDERQEIERYLGVIAQSKRFGFDSEGL